MSDPITITLDGKPYAIQQLTIGQMRDIHIGVVLPDAVDPQENTRRSWDRAVAIISAALIESDASFTPEAIYKMRFTIKERNAAVSAILKFAGLGTSTEESPQGEAAAGAA